MPRTRTTFPKRGPAESWGDNYAGPAKGEGKHHPFTEEGRKKGTHKVTKIMTFDDRMKSHLRSEACALEMMYVWREIALSGRSEIARAMCGEKVVERIWGKVPNAPSEERAVPADLQPDPPPVPDEPGPENPIL